MKRYVRAIIVATLCTLVVTMINGKTSISKETFLLKDVAATIQTETINNSSKFIESKINIPIISISNKKVEKKINKKIKDDIMNFANSSKEEAQNFFDDFPDAPNKFEADADFEVRKNKGKIISIVVKYYKYSGGAHGITENVPYNIEIETGKILTLKDIFDDDISYKTIINKEIKNQITKYNKENNLDENSNQLYDFKSINDNQKFYLEEDNLIIIFDVYEIAPYVAGIPEFPINYKDIKEHINKEYEYIFS